MLITVKNTDSILHSWNGQDILPNETYDIQEQEREKWARNDQFLIDLANGLAELIYLGITITSYTDALNVLKNNLPTEVIPTAPKNEHSLEPLGCEGDVFESNPANGDKYVCSITLSNKSQDGLTFTYNSDIVIEPSIGNYVFQKESFRRSWITSIDTVNHTVTFEMPNLDNGDGVYSKGFYIDVLIRDWSPLMYLWSLTLTVDEYEYVNDEWVLDDTPCTDFVELSVVDKSDMFLNDTITNALFGVDAVDSGPYLEALKFEDNGEYNHWTRYYDESWVCSVNRTNVPSPDGAPGELLAGLWLRLSIFSTSLTNHKYKVYLDYYLTSKS